MVNLAVFGSMNSVELGSIPLHKRWRQRPKRPWISITDALGPAKRAKTSPKTSPKAQAWGWGDGFINDVASD